MDGVMCCCLSSDTEGSFIVERVAEIAAAAVQHIANVAGRDSESDDPGQFIIVSQGLLV